MRVDVHAHYSPTVYFDHMAELGAFEELPVFRIMKALYRPGSGKPGGERPPSRDDVEGRIADMDAAAIDIQIVSLGAAQPYFSEEAKAVEGASLANDLFHRLMTSHPTRFSAFGALPLPHVRPAIAEIARCLDDLGFAGLSMGCSAGGVPIDDPVFDDLWLELDARHAPVYIHPGAAIDGVVGCTEFHLAPDFVSPAEMGVAAARLVIGGHLERFPNVDIILATTGGSLPFFARRFDRGLRQDDAVRYEELGGFLTHLDKFHYDTSVLEEPLVLETALGLVGAARLMLGSDYARPGVTSRAAVDYVEAVSGLTDQQRRDILGSNALRVLGSRLPAV
ncbi:MAG: amidohydrolase family protein [Microbacterium sp.]|uniref:amidohydrolase family protein n=1 Tax=Microbacterium sp. TaxID=51671 RepID=UPI003F81E45C